MLHALVQGVAVTESRAEVAAELGKANGFDVESILASPHFLVGTAEEIVENLVERRARWGISYWTLVGPQNMDAFGPIAQRLAGT